MLIIEKGAPVFVRISNLDERDKCPKCGLLATPSMIRRKLMDTDFIDSVFVDKKRKKIIYKLVNDKNNWNYCNHMIIPQNNVHYNDIDLDEVKNGWQE